MFTNNHGYTLLEILIATVLMMTMLGGSVAAYRNFEERQQLTNAGRELANVLRDTQKRAQSGDKPTQCTSQLQYWRLRPTGSSYVIEAFCGGSNHIALQQYDLSKYGVSFDTSQTVQFSVLNGRANANATFRLRRTGSARYTINVTQAGGISDIGIN